MNPRNVFVLWAAAAFSVCSASLSVPTFALDALDVKVSAVTDALRENGLLAIEMPPEYLATRNFALSGVCSCWNSLSEARSVLGGGSVSGLLQQGSRTTVATATAGSTPLPLPSEVAQICGTDVAEALDALRDQVATASQAFVSIWDRSVPPSRVPLLRTKHGVEYRRIHDIVESSTNLEHFHLYSKTQDYQQQDEEDHDLSVHTDAGLFLSFAPALDCTNGGDSSFWAENHRGELQQVDFPENAVIIMMGAGAEHWLQSPSDAKVRATRHAVRMHAGTMRAWYGMMHLVPATAIIQEFPEPRTLADLQQALVHTRSDATLQERYQEDTISMGCGSVPVQDSSKNNNNDDDSTSPRRRLAMVDNASVCNNVTNFYCWMSCLDIPHADHAQSHLESGHALYCVDPSVMDSTSNNVSQAVEPCIGENGLLGSAMNPICVGSWQPKVEHLALVPVRLDVTNVPEAPYCYGGSTMFHRGFEWDSATCVVYLFPQWVLSTQAKFIAACFGTVLLGLLVEFVLYQRRKVLKRMEQSSRVVRLATSASIYGLQLTMGYLVMLIVMIYSAPLFVSVIGGLVLGHVLFNAKDAVFSASTASAVNLKDKVSEEDGTDKGSQVNCCSSEDNDNVEGITPCCRHTM